MNKLGKIKINHFLRIKHQLKHLEERMEIECYPLDTFTLLCDSGIIHEWIWNLLGGNMKIRNGHLKTMIGFNSQYLSTQILSSH